MKKFFDKDEVWFAVAWIAVYVLAFGNADSISESIGRPKLLTAMAGLVLSLVLLGFVRKHSLEDYLGLRAFRGSGRDFLYFIPLALISGVNLWNGLTLNYDPATSVLAVLSMCFVGFLEELIFRGLLFRGMAKSGVKAAIAVSSLTFGAGHIVNLLLGAPLFETLLQLVYASAIGFCFTAVVYVGGSIWPCVIAHAAVNSLSVFAVEPGKGMQIAMAAVTCLVGLAYGALIMRRGSKNSKKS